MKEVNRMAKKKDIYDNYKYYNLAPSGFKATDDCQVRAIATAFGWSYRTARRKVWRYAYRHGADDISDEVTLYAFITEHAKQNVLYVDRIGKHNFSQFAHEYPTGSWILFCEGHMACVKDGVLLDQSDTRKKMVYYAWRVK